jgi:hypothetical protein
MSAFAGSGHRASLGIGSSSTWLGSPQKWGSLMTTAATIDASLGSRLFRRRGRAFDVALPFGQALRPTN